MRLLKIDEIWTFGHEPTENERLAANKAITLIQELQQYRTIETVEELKSILIEISEGQDDVDDSGISVGLLHTLLEHAAYSELGTVEECREAVERQRGKKPIKITPCKSVNYYKCSLCGKLLSIDQPFCEECGNAVDWSE